MGVVNYQRLLA